MLAFLGLHFNHTWDLTAAGTLLLAFFTLVTLIVSAVSLRQTRKAIEVSRREVEEAHRPVVVPLADRRRLDPAGAGVGPGPAQPKVPEQGFLIVPIENIGSGPAVRLEAKIETWLTESGDWSAIGVGPQTPAVVAGLGVGILMPLEIKVPHVSGLSGFVLALTYMDVAGKAWTTSARYIPDRDGYEDVRIGSMQHN